MTDPDTNKGCYVLVRNLSENSVWISGTYEVTWVKSLDNIDPERQEVIEVSRVTSGAEWVRLIDRRDELKTAHEVMES